MITSLKAAQPDDLAWRGNEPPQACAAWPKDPAADPVGRGCGVPVPPDGRPCGSVTPWRSRHYRKAEFCDAVCDVPELDDDELAPQPATARAAVSTTAPSTPGLAARPGRRWDRRVNNVLHWLQAERTWRRAVRDRVSRRLQSTGRVLRFRCGRLRAFCPAARAFSREAAATAVQVPISTLAASGSRTWKAAPCPGWVSTMISPPWAATSEAAIDKPSPAPPPARGRASSVR